MTLNYMGCDGQSQTGVSLLSTEEGIEKPFSNLRRNPLAGIHNFQNRHRSIAAGDGSHAFSGA